MFEFHALRATLGLMQIGIIWVLLRRDIGYLWRFGVVMFASAAMNIAPSFPHDASWQMFVQIPAYLIIFILTAEATLELFAFLRRRTFIEERAALIAWAAMVGLIPVWICWWWPGDNWYQNVLLIRQYALMWLTGGYWAAWFWLRAARPIHMELQIADHGEFWGFWLLIATTHASTTKWGVFWRFLEWQGSADLWRIAGDFLTLTQICICCGFLVNLWRWKQDDDAAAVPISLPDLPNLEQSRPRRLLHL
jgi:hypothetical protein